MNHSQNIETSLLYFKDYSNTKSFKILSDLSGINTNTVSVIVDKCTFMLHADAFDWVCLGIDFIDEVNRSYNQDIYNIIINDLKNTYPIYSKLIASDFNDFCNNGNYLMYYYPEGKSIDVFFVSDIKKKSVMQQRILVDENCTTCDFDNNKPGYYKLSEFYEALNNNTSKATKTKKDAFTNYLNNVMPNNSEYIEYLKTAK